MAANARDPKSRKVALEMGLTLDKLEMCSDAYDWLCRAAHMAGDSANAPRKDEPDDLYWRELGIFLVHHDQLDEAREVAMLATLAQGLSYGQPLAR